MTDVGDNRRHEYQQLRDEILASDRTCVLIMGYLVAMTGAAGAVFLEQGIPVLGVIIGLAWFLGFWYLTEKRFVIKRLGFYIKNRIEKYEEELTWQHWQNAVSKSVPMRPVVRVGPYYLEAGASLLVIFAIPIVGILTGVYSWDSAYFLISVVLALAFFLFMVLLLFAYGKYYKKLTKADSEVESRNP